MNPAQNNFGTTATVAMFSWPLVALLVFCRLPPRRAVIVLFLAGWMFMPDAHYKLPGIPEYNKTTATTLGILLAVLVFDLRSLTSLRPCLGDIPMLVYCLCPFASSITNGLGAYDGASAVFTEVVSWGLPYLLGRAYLRSFDAFRELARLLFIGGLIYVPLCLYEIRMSPHLSRTVYGYGEAGGGEYTNELGPFGSRPRVFMGTGLTLGTFLTAASLMGTWLWYTGAIKKVWGYRAGLLLGILLVTALVSKNMGAMSELLFGLAALFSIRALNRGFLVYLLIAAAPLYMGVRASGNWSADSLVEMASMIHKTRGESLQFRLDNDSVLAEKALQRPVFGWGGWGRSRIYREDGKDIAVTDGLWIIALGTTGIVGLGAVTAVLLVPAAMFVYRYPVHLWTDPRVAGAAASAILVVLYMIDNLFNSMFNPLYVLAAGGLVTVATCRAQVCPKRAVRRAVRRTPPVGTGVPAYGSSSV